MPTLAGPVPAGARSAFDDGNARTAFLALVFVLAREDVTLNDVGLLRRVTLQADASEDPVILARYIDLHPRETRRTTDSPGSASS